MTILNSTVLAADQAAAIEIDPLPPMIRHTPEEFDFAQKTLHKMVADSALFPDRAERADWFRPRDAVGGRDAHEESAASTVAIESITSTISSYPVSDDGDVPPNAPAKSSRIHSEEAARSEYSSVPAIHERDVDYGALMGAGGFGEVRLARLKEDGKTGGEDSSNDGQYCYAMKYLSPTKLAPKEYYKPIRNKAFERGIADLAIEIRFLALLSHENIIKLHYVSQGELGTQFNCEDGENNYQHQIGPFLLLDPLVETLAKRFDETYLPEAFGRIGSGKVIPVQSSSRKHRSSISYYFKKLTHKEVNKEDSLHPRKIQLAKRLESLKGVASALQYLHDDCRVIYRDIKPDNIGFYRKPNPQCQCGKRSPSSQQEGAGCTCYTEVTKLFDFGLAKELKPQYAKAHPLHQSDPNADPTYKLTARSGSRRYMSPEVALSCPYNEKADVYSFGIVLYQIASLVMPFEGYSSYWHEEDVLARGNRPNVTIPRGAYSLRKTRKDDGMSYVDWLARWEKKDCNPDVIAKKNKRLALRTKCVWTRELKTLIEECWHHDMRLRPKMKDVVERLEGCIQQLTATKCLDDLEEKRTMRLRELSSVSGSTLRTTFIQETDCVRSRDESVRDGIPQ